MKSKILNTIIISLLLCNVNLLKAQEEDSSMVDSSMVDSSKVEEVIEVVALVRKVVILSGIEDGSYNRMAKDIRNLAKEDTLLEIEVLTSRGSAYNFRKFIKSKYIDITFMQYDVLLYEQLFDMKHNRNFTKHIRLLLPLGTEQIHLITRTDSKINGIEDLKKKIVAIGSSDQGTNRTARYIKEKTEINWIDKEIALEASFLKLLNGTIDAFFFVGAAPVKKLDKLPKSLRTQIKLVPIIHPELEKDYKIATIPSNSYKWAEDAFETFAVNVVLVTDVQHETPEKIENLLKVLNLIQENISELKQNGHPAWKEVDFKFEDFDDFDLHQTAKEVFNQ